MITSEFTDKDGFKLQFDETCSEDDKKFFRQEYPIVDVVANQKLHCTTCDVHIGTAPISEKIIRTHQVLGVTQCNKCFAFYNSGEFGKGEDGSEYYCRWCGQGGEVFCCSTCPFVFCNKCIRGNLTNSYVKEIEETDDWSCFVCDKKILQKQRGHHWALRNFMNKQLEKIQKINITSEDDLNNLLNEDVSTCCPRRKRKSLVKPVPAPVKRPSMNGGYMTAAQPPAKKINVQPPSRSFRMPNVQTYRPSPQPKQMGPGKKNDEIVCTPDILGLFNDNGDDSGAPSTSSTPSTSLVPPPLVMRNNQRTVRPTAPPAATAATPIYHNVNGFQIDLNHAARQEIFRLPNGKLIQVRKQTGPPSQTPLRPGMAVASTPRGPQFTIRQANPVSVRAPYQPRASPQARQRFTSQPQPRFTFSDGRVVAQPPPNATPAPPVPAASTVFTQQNGSISVARAPQPNTPFGTAKTEFEDKIISGMEICQHTINKMITLTNSTSFKTSGNFKDLKDLYIHLQYLFTYTSGKFQTLQDSLKTGMESLAKHDVHLKDKGDDDELEIVEEKQDVIEVMSDDEEPPAPKESEKAATPVVKKPLLKHIQYTAGDTPESAAAESGQEASGEAEKAPEVVKVAPTPMKITPEIAEIMESDNKLRKKVLVKVEKLEDTKNPIIKQFVAQLQARTEAEAEASDDSREGTPTNLFEPMVMIDEGGGEKENDKETAEKSQETTETALETTEKLVTSDAESTEKSAEVPKDDEVVEVPSDDDDVVETVVTKEPESMEVDGEKGEAKEDVEKEQNVAEKEAEVAEKETEAAEKEPEGAEKEPDVAQKEEKQQQVDEDKKAEEENNENAPEVDTIELDDSIQEKNDSTDPSEHPEKSPEEESTAETNKPDEIPLETVENGQEPSEIPVVDVQLPEVHEISQETLDTIEANGFLDSPPNGATIMDTSELVSLDDKHDDDLPTIEEVTKLVTNEMDVEKAMLEDLFNELENKTTAMEVD